MALVTHVPVTCDEARGIRCPYTGKEHQIVMHICEDIVTYSVPDALDLSEPRVSISELYDVAGMRDGILGVVPPEEALVDPYDPKNTMTLVDGPSGYYLEGGFNPREATMNLAEFIRKLSRGERDISPAPAAQSVEHPGDFQESDDPNDKPHEAMDEFSQKIAEQMTRAMPGVDTTTRVSMSTTSKEKDRKPRGSSRSHK